MKRLVADMHPEDIKAQIRKRGQTLEGLARANLLSGQALRNALRVPVRAGELVIADFLGKPPQDIWPSRWDAEGNRRIRFRNPVVSQNRVSSY